MEQAREYAVVASRIRDRVRDQSSLQERMKIVVDLLWDGLGDKGVSWVGFYLDQPGQPDDRRMILGPSRNKPACSPIGLHGACGRALLSRQPLIVRDVKELGANYIACDPRDRSEIVIPLMDAATGSCWGVLDLDSFEVGAFDEGDERGLREVLRAGGL
jgi:putative methionine-R-sulfoxide reductase with GAF domain